MPTDDSNPSTRIRALNDAFRRSFTGGAVVVTAGVAAMPAVQRRSLIRMVRDFEAFDEDNDPHGEHNLGVVEIGDIRCFWKIDLYERAAVKHYSIAEPLLASLPRGSGRRFRIVRSWPCAPAHRLVSGESASTLFPQSLFTYAESPKAQVANQTTTRPQTAINFPGRQPPHRWRGKPVDRVSNLECGSFRNDAIFDEAPECDCKLSGQRDDADLAATHAFVAETLAPPQRQFAVGLIAEPEPSQLDECLPRELVAGLADSSIAIDVATIVRSGGQPDERRHVSPRFKRAMVDLGDQDGCCCLAHGAKRRQVSNLLGVREASRVVAEGFFSFGFDLCDLLRDQVVTEEHALDVAPEEWRQRAAITSLHRFEMLLQALADAFAGEPNPVERQKALDAPDDSDSLFNQAFSFPLDALRILLLDTRNMDIAGHFAITCKPSAQSACHAFGIEPIGLGAAATARHQETRRVEYNCADITRGQEPGKPEAIVADFVTKHDLHRSTQLVLCLGLAVLENADQPIDIAGLDLVDGRLAVAWRSKRAHPTRLAQLKRHTANVARIDGCRHWRNSRVGHQRDRQERTRFGAFPLHRIYYDPSLEAGSADPADPAKTTRVLTLMLAEEY